MGQVTTSVVFNYLRIFFFFKIHLSGPHPLKTVYNLYIFLKTTLNSGSNINQRLFKKAIIRTIKHFSETFLIQPIYLKIYLNFRPLFYRLWDGNLTDMLCVVYLFLQYLIP